MDSTKMNPDHGIQVETAEDDLKDAEVNQQPVIEGRAGKEKELIRKIDLRMMPLMMLICESRSLVFGTLHTVMFSY